MRDEVSKCIPCVNMLRGFFTKYLIHLSKTEKVNSKLFKST